MMKPWHDGLPETSEYVILPPACALAGPGAKARLGAFLVERFPDLAFDVAEPWPGQGDRYGVIPLCGTLRDDGQSDMRAPGSDSLVMAIKEALRSFDLARTGLS